MEIIEKKENQMIIKAKIEEELANAIRRSVNKIPIVAIEDVEISKNDSPLYDETVAHRLGLIPLKLKKFNEKKPFELNLDAKGEGFVYSGDMKGDIEVVYDKIPITYLKKGEVVKILATTKENTASEHARFSPGFIFYKNIAEIKLESNCPKEIIDICPKKVFNENAGKIKIENKDKCNLCGLCVEYCKKQGKDFIDVKPSDELLIAIESFGQINSRDIFEKSVEILKKNLNEFSKGIK